MDVVVLRRVEAGLALDAVGAVARGVQRLDTVRVALGDQAAIGDERDGRALQRLEEPRRGNPREVGKGNLARERLSRELRRQHGDGALRRVVLHDCMTGHAAREVAFRRRRS